MAAKTFAQWEKEQMRKRYAENLKLKLFLTGKCNTHFLRFVYRKGAETVTISSAENSIRLPMAQFMEFMTEFFMAEIPAELPLLNPQLRRETVVRAYAGVLPEYGKPEKTMAEVYAERLRNDRWNVRKNGDPCDWRHQ